MFFLVLLIKFISIIKNIIKRTLSKIFNRGKLLLSEKNRNKKLIGYARAMDSEGESLKEQIDKLNELGCNVVFSEIISINENFKPELAKAFRLLSSGDELVLTKLDRAFNSKSDFITIMCKLYDDGINLKTLSGFSSSENSPKDFHSIFKVLNELEKLESDNLSEKKREMNKKRKIIGDNCGGRPKISPLKESLVMRLRGEGFSYRSIRSQTGLALSTIRRIIIDSQLIKK